jgi:hypothetical protein
VCFLSSPRSRGSLLACRLAARLGVSVFVFCVGFSPSRLPRIGRGSWSLVQVAGISACQWSPKPLKKQIKEIYESITYSQYDFRCHKFVKRIREEVKSIFTYGLLLSSIVFAIVVHHFVPTNPKNTQQLQSTQKIEQIYTDYQELLLEFHDENESAKCLQWLNTTPAKQLRSTLKKAKIHSNRIDTLLSHRPYYTWTEVYFLPKIGIKTIEQIIDVWRKSK